MELHTALVYGNDTLAFTQGVRVRIPDAVLLSIPGTTERRQSNWSRGIVTFSVAARTVIRQAE